MIQLTSITQHYGVRPILRNLNLQVAKGELLAVMGPNGTGKSTLLNVIAGVLSPQKGEVRINNLVRRSSVEAENSIRRMVAFLPDHPWLPMSRTGREYLLAVGSLYVEDKDRVIEHSERLLRLFNLSEQADSAITSYSNGQKKKVAVAGALMTDATVFIFDEPFTGGLDPAGVAVLKRLLKRLAEREDVTVVLATQISDIARALANRIALIKDGAVSLVDTPANIIARQQGAANLEDAVESYLNPEALAKLEDYLREEEQ